jgi:hypothetical protein
MHGNTAQGMIPKVRKITLKQELEPDSESTKDNRL